MLENNIYIVLCKLYCHTLCSFSSAIENAPDYYRRFFDDRSVWGNISIRTTNQQVNLWCNGYTAGSDPVVKQH